MLLLVLISVMKVIQLTAAVTYFTVVVVASMSIYNVYLAWYDILLKSRIIQV